MNDTIHTINLLIIYIFHKEYKNSESPYLLYNLLSNLAAKHFGCKYLETRWQHNKTLTACFLVIRYCCIKNLIDDMIVVKKKDKSCVRQRTPDFSLEFKVSSFLKEKQDLTRYDRLKDIKVNRCKIEFLDQILSTGRYY